MVPRGRPELARRLANVAEPAEYEFRHRANGTRVLDCFLPNRALTGRVDTAAAVVVMRSAAGKLARKWRRRVLLHESLFPSGSLPTAWLAITLPTTDALRSALNSSLGVEWAGYVLASGLPPSGRSVASAVLDVAAAVDSLGATRTLDGHAATGYRITLDPDRFAEATSDSFATPGRPKCDVVAPRQVWIDDRDQVVRIAVIRIAVRPGPSTGSTTDPDLGWTIDYEVPAPPLTVAEPESVTDAERLPIDRLATPLADRSCEVPL